MNVYVPVFYVIDINVKLYVINLYVIIVSTLNLVHVDYNNHSFVVESIQRANYHRGGIPFHFIIYSPRGAPDRLHFH